MADVDVGQHGSNPMDPVFRRDAPAGHAPPLNVPDAFEGHLKQEGLIDLEGRTRQQSHTASRNIDQLCSNRFAGFCAGGSPEKCGKPSTISLSVRWESTPPLRAA